MTHSNESYNNAHISRFFFQLSNLTASVFLSDGLVSDV